MKERRERYLEFIRHPKKRRRFTRELGHFRHLDPRYVIPIVRTHQQPEDVAHILRAKGAPDTCWVVSEDDALDGKGMSLADALHAVVGAGMGTFVSCIPGKLAYFENEDHRIILERQ